MKYIRTEDRIYEPTKWQCDLSSEMILVKADNKFGNDKVFTRDIIKQADTIKELCDEFVVIGYKINDPFIFSKEGISIDDFWKHSPSDTIVYGAIWTEWGLKYVSKMNEKGELELL